MGIEDWNIFIEDSLRKIKDSLRIGRKRSTGSFKVAHSDFKVNNGIRNEEKGESSYSDARDVHGGEDGIPFGNENNDFEKVGTIDDNDPVKNFVIDIREKLKETVEYKRAQEEEQSARQEAIKLQAEEAQQLRLQQKRKRAEDLRLSDLEMRKKQRVEEIRETQKKDEEDMNLKEEYRMEVKEALKELELNCLDMASLLRGLGINVGNGLVPLPHEVHATYKRALLSFHPDRASGLDMRQQIEAEEKFKLISRMKENFSS